MMMMHERALSNKMNNDRADGHCHSFADLGRSLTPNFPAFDESFS